MKKGANKEDIRLRIAEQNRAIAELRLHHVQRERAKAEYQNGWYENAPLSWLVKKTARAFDRAVSNRLAKQAALVPVFDRQKQVTMPDTPTPGDIRSLALSYQDSVSYRQAGPSGVVRVGVSAVWLAYRIVRKTARMVLRPVIGKPNKMQKS